MRLRFYIDEDTELPHIYAHNISEQEVRDVLRSPLEQIKGRGDSLIALGRTVAGRYLKVIFSPDEVGDGIFVITAFEPTDNEVRALRRRLRRRKR
ncbi:MAG TPA: DUF4258 domain-containing protein [Tepidisphaeraceae bacterium]|jgi:hypothetical protein|nr:DUF4258 domain-containing protein [Tepidisphaeraceae bacterium]